MSHQYDMATALHSPHLSPSILQNILGCINGLLNSSKKKKVKVKKKKKKPRLAIWRPEIQPHLYYQLPKSLGMSFNLTVNSWRQGAVVGLEEI